MGFLVTEVIFSYKKAHVGRFNRLIKLCGDKLGTQATMEIFDNLGRESGLKEYNALIAVCLEKARTSNDEDDALEHMSEAFRTFKKIREQGFEVEEGTYGNPSSVARLGYYEMLLWIRVNNEEKIQELCLAADDKEVDFALKDYDLVDISWLVFSYFSGIPNLAVHDLFLKFKSLHMKFKITPSSASYEKLITFCCELHKVHLALDIADEMCEVGLSLSIDTLHSILYACEEIYEYNLVRRIYDLICHHNLKPNGETFRSMISLSARMKDFSGAYTMLNDMKFNVTSTCSIYNTILAGYFREGNISGALMILKEMGSEDIQPDSHTFSYLIGNCNLLRRNEAYWSSSYKAYFYGTNKCICSLWANWEGKTGNQAKGGTLEPKVAIVLIEHFTSEGELSILLQVLEEIQDPDYWVDGCCRLVLHCVRNKHLRSAIDLLKQLNDKLHTDDLAMEAVFDKPNDLRLALALLQAMKDEFGLTPSRKRLDFLLLAMYQALLASGDPKSSKSLLTKIPMDDPHVRCIIKACRESYVQSSSMTKTEAEAEE
ncbi:hypothetical protein F3Y22_tig00110472pilonHSYRG00005 [Hibiscus syriacus]|uniref:Pentatricopeptide repeat-containing protein n=1 Tax=Hibiscus syriacus TaxID=106335 RepID=A0A6A3AF08_HIBSY|nr:hypothetical protein F3Y22_tig00110472pilonHSYRG00005 [Hibiscus syriacus]